MEFSLLNRTYTVSGLDWPATLGDFSLMGPVNCFGAWRWYQRSVVIDDQQVIERVKIDSQLQPIWDSLARINA